MKKTFYTWYETETYNENTGTYSKKFRFTVEKVENDFQFVLSGSKQVFSQNFIQSRLAKHEGCGIRVTRASDKISQLIKEGKL